MTPFGPNLASVRPPSAGLLPPLLTAGNCGPSAKDLLEQNNRRHFSTNNFRLARASSHCAETEPRKFRRSSRGRGLRTKRLSRPAREQSTIRALCNTRRCFVIAWRVRREPRVSCEMECGRPSLSLVSSDSRVSSPRAAKTGACVRRLVDERLGLLRDMVSDVLHLHSPAAIVLAECKVTAIGGQLVEA